MFFFNIHWMLFCDKVLQAEQEVGNSVPGTQVIWFFSSEASSFSVCTITAALAKVSEPHGCEGSMTLSLQQAQLGHSGHCQQWENCLLLS